MKKIFIVTLFLASISFAQEQNEIRASMGIDFVSVPVLTDYLNQNFAPLNDQIGSFVSAVNFSGSYGRLISESYQLQLEVGYLLYSYTTGGFGGQYDLSYSLIMPSILNYYVIAGKGYNFKFGGGVGVRFLSASESLPATGITTDYSSTGFGAIIRAEGNTALGQNIYAHIAADIRYDWNGEPENNGEKLYNNIQNENVNFNSLSFGVRLGVSYTF